MILHRKITVEVAYATSTQQVIRNLFVEAGTSVAEAIEQSGILEQFPDIDLSINKVGLFGELTELDASIHDGDRVEIYRPLVIDPKQARKRRAQQGENST